MSCCCRKKPCPEFCKPVGANASRDSIIQAANQYLDDSPLTVIGNDKKEVPSNQAKKLDSNLTDVVREQLGSYNWCFLKTTLFLEGEAARKYRETGLTGSGLYVDTGFPPSDTFYRSKLLVTEEASFIASFPIYFVSLLQIALATKVAAKPLRDLTLFKFLSQELEAAKYKAERNDIMWSKSGCFECRCCECNRTTQPLVS